MTASTLVDPSASLVDKGLAVFDLASPVSSGEIRAGARAVEGAVDRIGDARRGARSGNGNPYNGPVSEDIVVVDRNGNAIPVRQGEDIASSPNGDFQQVRSSEGRPTGDRMDRAGHPRQSDPAAQAPHGHRVRSDGSQVTRSDGNPHLPIRDEP